MNGIKVFGVRWFNFTTRDLVLVAVLIAATGVFQTVWADFILGLKVLGPLEAFIGSYGFNIAAFVVIYLIPKPGSATLVKTFSGVIELMLGNPVGPVVIFYDFVEGFGIDIAYVLFGRKLSLNMMIIGSLIAWVLAAPVDAYRDAVPLTFPALAAYFGPGGVGKVWISWLCYLTIEAMKRAGIKPLAEPAIVEVASPSQG